MNKIEFDKALSEFLDDDECERESEAIYGLIRTAFQAGWRAAIGSDPVQDGEAPEKARRDS